MPYLIPLDAIVKFQSKGLLTIPKRLRNAAGFEENGFARIKLEKRRLVIEPVRTLPYPVRSYTDAELQSFLDLDNKESKELRAKDLL